MAGLAGAGRRVVFAAIVVLGLFAFGFDAPAQAKAGPGVGSGAFTLGYAGGSFTEVSIYPANGGLKYLAVQRGSCYSGGNLLLPSEYKVAADLSTASVHKATRCGWVSMRWTGQGGLHHDLASLYRNGTASGSVNGAGYVSPSSGYGDAVIYVRWYP